MKIELWPIEKVIPYARNPRRISEAAISKVKASIKEFGVQQPIVVDKEGVIIVGHTRYAALQQLEVKEVPVHVADKLTPAQVKSYRIMDNRSHLESSWDDDLLKLELTELDDWSADLELTGFDEGELQVLMAPVFGGPDGGLTDEDEAPEVQPESVTKLGDVWVLDNRHRLCCGDSFVLSDMENLLKGHSVDLIVTSPPYNQGIDKFSPSGMHKDHDWVSKVRRLAYADTKPELDYQNQQRDLLGLLFGIVRDGASIFYNHKPRYREKKLISPMEWLPGPFSLRQEIIWKRPGSVTQNARMFLPCDERIYWMYKGDDFTFNDSTEVKTWSSVWDVAPRQNKDHAVAFPVELPLRCILACSMVGDSVFDPFCGSGTTIIASEKAGRNGHGMEISPLYVDVSIRRWQSFTGKSAVLEGDGRTFDEIAKERLVKAA